MGRNVWNVVINKVISAVQIKDPFLQCVWDFEDHEDDGNGKPLVSIYKQGGATGTTVATVTYDYSTLNHVKKTKT